MGYEERSFFWTAVDMEAIFGFAAASFLGVLAEVLGRGESCDALPYFGGFFKMPFRGAGDSSTFYFYTFFFIYLYNSKPDE